MLTIIAEVKPISPFGFKSPHTVEYLIELAFRVGDMISIHTDARWGGSYELLEMVASISPIPVLAKGIHPEDSDIERALNHGADWVLVVGRTPGVHKKSCLIEPNSIQELSELAKDSRAVWNARDLTTGQPKAHNFSEARAVRKEGWLCQASFIRTIEDVHPEADAVLVGEHLVLFAESL